MRFGIKLQFFDRHFSQMNWILIGIMLFLTACGNSTSATSPTPQLIKIHASAASQPWLVKAYNCADELPVVLSNVADARQAEIDIHFGEPGELTTKAYQLGVEDLLVVANPSSKFGKLSATEVAGLFSDNSGEFQLWVFAPGEDIQQVFAQSVLQQRVITSLAHVAVSSQQMSDALNQDKDAVGIISRRLNTGNAREIFSLTNVPILALVKTEPQGLVKALLACMQK